MELENKLKSSSQKSILKDAKASTKQKTGNNP
jgi:hypothetical protein